MTELSQLGVIMGLSLPHLIVLFLVFSLFFYPIARILKRAGYSGWLVLLGLIPFVGIIGLWWFAFANWPNVRDDSTSFR